MVRAKFKVTCVTSKELAPNYPVEKSITLEPVYDSKIAEDVSFSKRQAAKLTLREMARALDFSAPYICDVELGRRHCTADLLKAYESL